MASHRSHGRLASASPGTSRSQTPSLHHTLPPPHWQLAVQPRPPPRRRSQNIPPFHDRTSSARWLSNPWDQSILPGRTGSKDDRGHGRHTWRSVFIPAHFHCHTALQCHLFYWHFYPAIFLFWWRVISTFYLLLTSLFLSAWERSTVPGFTIFKIKKKNI